MADRKDYFFRQKVTEAELDGGFDDLENADRNITSDAGLIGIFQNASVTEATVPNLTVDVTGPAVIYDQTGRRINWSATQNVDVSVDENSASTAVTTGGNEKQLSVFAEFDRLLSDPRTDGNGATVFFERDESFSLNVVQGSEAPLGTSTPPPLRSDQILLCDITIIFGQSAILNADIDLVGRREDAFVVAAGAQLAALRQGQTEATISALHSDVDTVIDGIITGGASGIGYAGGPAWADTTTNPATNVEAQLDKIITDLGSGNGMAKLSGVASGVPNQILAAGTGREQLELLEAEIITGGWKHGALRRGIDLISGAAGVNWTRTGSVGANDFPHWSGTASSGILFLPFDLFEGDVLVFAEFIIESAVAVPVDSVLARYDNNGTTRTRTILDSSTGDSGLGFATPVNLTPGSTETVGGGSVYYAIEITTTAAVGTRRIIGASVEVDRQAA